MRRTLPWLAAAIGLAAARPAPAAAQQPAAATPLAVGSVAPDFTLPGATRFGILRDSIRLSDFQGKTVVLAFFFRARTRG
jgi:hypothetical protein